MNIWAGNGDKVRYVGEHGTDYDRESAEEYLEIGETYVVDRVEVIRSSSSVWLDGIEIGFNTVMFEDVDIDEMESIQRQEEWDVDVDGEVPPLELKLAKQCKYLIEGLEHCTCVLCRSYPASRDDCKNHPEIAELIEKNSRNLEN